MSTRSTTDEPGVVTFVEGPRSTATDPKAIAKEAARLVDQQRAAGQPITFAEAVARIVATSGRGAANAMNPEAIAARARVLEAQAHASGKALSFTEAVHRASIES